MIEIETLQWVLSRVDTSKQEECYYAKAKQLVILWLAVFCLNYCQNQKF